MHWIFIALAAPILWAITNHLDKYLLVKYGEKDGSIGSLMLFSTLFSVIVIPILFLIQPDILSISVQDRIILASSGILYALFTYFYLHALFRDEASVVMPIFQVIPVFGFIFSYILLGETLTLMQVVGSIVVIIFSFILALDIEEGSLSKIKWPILVLTFIASGFYALSETIFKYSTTAEVDFVPSLFLNHVGLLVVGLFILFSRKSRRGFFSLVKSNVGPILGLNVSGETITLLGDIATRFALLLAPVTFVLVVAGTQPFFVLVLGLLLTILFPKIFSEKLTKRHLVHKIISILGIIGGSIIIMM